MMSRCPSFHPQEIHGTFPNFDSTSPSDQVPSIFPDSGQTWKTLCFNSCRQQIRHVVSSSWYLFALWTTHFKPWAERAGWMSMTNIKSNYRLFRSVGAWSWHLWHVSTWSPVAAPCEEHDDQGTMDVLSSAITCYYHFSRSFLFGISLITRQTPHTWHTCMRSHQEILARDAQIEEKWLRCKEDFMVWKVGEIVETIDTYVFLMWLRLLPHIFAWTWAVRLWHWKTDDVRPCMIIYCNDSQPTPVNKLFDLFNFEPNLNNLRDCWLPWFCRTHYSELSIKSCSLPWAPSCSPEKKIKASAGHLPGWISGCFQFL